MDSTALFKVGYGLYVLTAHENGKDNGCIVNTVLQITSAAPFVGVVVVNKQNYTHDMIMNTKKFNISTLTTEAPFELFKRFGFQSGKTADKFEGLAEVARSENGLLYLTKSANAFLSFEVTDTKDFGTHTMFIGTVTAAEVLNKAESVTYAYYQSNIKPKPQPAAQTGTKVGWRCKICGYIYEGEELPADFVCPICKHGAGDFEKILF